MKGIDRGETPDAATPLGSPGFAAEAAFFGGGWTPLIGQGKGLACAAFEGAGGGAGLTTPMIIWAERDKGGPAATALQGIQAGGTRTVRATPVGGPRNLQEVRVPGPRAAHDACAKEVVPS